MIILPRELNGCDLLAPLLALCPFDDMNEIVKNSLKYRVFPYLYQKVGPHGNMGEHVSTYHQHVRVINAQKSFIEAFSRKAEENKLRFVLMKGLGLARRLYGNDYARTITDIDILVSPCQVTLCDYVLKALGLQQMKLPSDYGQYARDGAVPRQRIMQNIDSYIVPVAQKRYRGADQLLPYFSFSYEHPLRLEVHDSHYFLPDGAVDELFWSASTMEIANSSVRVPSFEYAMALLMVAAYKNSESYYGTSFNDLNLRDYLDLALAFQKFPHHVGWGGVRDIAIRHSFESIVCDTLRNFASLYSEEYIPAQLAQLIYENVPQSTESLMMRFQSGSVRKRHEVGKLLDIYRHNISGAYEMLELTGDPESAGALVGYSDYANDVGLKVRYALFARIDGFSVVWSLALGSVEDLEFFSFQMAFHAYEGARVHPEVIINVRKLGEGFGGVISRSDQLVRGESRLPGDGLSVSIKVVERFVYVIANIGFSCCAAAHSVGSDLSIMVEPGVFFSGSKDQNMDIKNIGKDEYKFYRLEGSTVPVRRLFQT